MFRIKCAGHDGYSLSGSFWVHTAEISRLTGRGGQSALQNCHPLQSGLWRRRAFLPPHAPGLQKVGKNKTVGRWYVWGQDPVKHSNKFYHQSCEGRKNAKIKKTTTDALGCHSPQLYAKSGSKSIDVASIKKALATYQPIFKPISHIILPGPVFVERRRNRLRQCLILGLLIAAKASRRPASLPIRRVRLQRRSPLADPGQPHEELRGGHPNQQQKWVSWRL